MESCIYFLYSFCLVYLQFLQVSRYLNCKSILISLGSWYMCEPIGFFPNVAHKWTRFWHKLKCYQSTQLLERLLPVIYNKHVWPVKKIQYFFKYDSKCKNFISAVIQFKFKDDKPTVIFVNAEQSILSFLGCVNRVISQDYFLLNTWLGINTA